MSFHVPLLGLACSSRAVGVQTILCMRVAISNPVVTKSFVACQLEDNCIVSGEEPPEMWLSVAVCPHFGLRLLFCTPMLYMLIAFTRTAVFASSVVTAALAPICCRYLGCCFCIKSNALACNSHCGDRTSRVCSAADPCPCVAEVTSAEPGTKIRACAAAPAVHFQTEFHHRSAQGGLCTVIGVYHLCNSQGVCTSSCINLYVCMFGSNTGLHQCLSKYVQPWVPDCEGKVLRQQACNCVMPPLIVLHIVAWRIICSSYSTGHKPFV